MQAEMLFRQFKLLGDGELEEIFILFSGGNGRI
jgi:hypothetical protein